ncbi:MAG: hypothetical protein WA130_10095 [Candidatus Methanoperedens sp.]
MATEIDEDKKGTQEGAKDIGKHKEKKTKSEEDDKQETLFNLRGDLRENQSKIQEMQRDFDKLKKENDQLGKDIAELEKSAKEVDQVIIDYDKVVGNIKQEKQALDIYCGDKWPGVKAANEKKEEEIKNSIKKVQDRIDNIKGRLNELEGDEKNKGLIKSAEEKHSKAQKDLETKQNAYDNLKNTQKLIDNKIKSLKDLKKSIEEQEDKGNKANMYFLIKEMDKEKNGLEIKEKDYLRKELNVAWKELKSAKEGFNKAEIELSNLKEEQKVNKKNLEDAEKSRKQDIFDALSIIR